MTNRLDTMATQYAMKAITDRKDFKDVDEPSFNISTGRSMYHILSYIIMLYNFILDEGHS